MLYDGDGRRQIYCDLKDIQQTGYPFDSAVLDGVDLVVACNTNFNRPLLRMARAAGKPIATDVHVLSDPYDGYNRDFLEYADLLFLSDEGIVSMNGRYATNKTAVCFLQTAVFSWLSWFLRCSVRIIVAWIGGKMTCTATYFLQFSSHYLPISGVPDGSQKYPRLISGGFGAF